jgi:hypothetical protein
MKLFALARLLLMSEWFSGSGALVSSGLGLGALTFLLLSSANAYDTFEHRYLGNAAYGVSELRKLVDPLSTGSQLSETEEQDLAHEMAIRFLRDVPVRFGDLPALAGDYTETVDDLSTRVRGFRDIKSDEVDRIITIRRQWLNACRWYHEHVQKANQPDTLDQCFPQLTKEQVEQILFKTVLPHVQLGSRGYSPTRMELGEFERLPEFSELAAKNRTHFPQHSWSTYIWHHYCALVFARAYLLHVDIVGPKSGCQPIKTPQSSALYQAILYEGFAQHFLHDSFSSGHIGVPYGWCAGEYMPRFFGPIPLICRPTKQLLQHTHDTLNHLGIKVAIPNPPTFLGRFREKLVDGWTAFGDDHLFIPEAAFHRAVLLRIAVESLDEVYKIATTKGMEAPDFMQTCREWQRVFPIPHEKINVPPSYDCKDQAGEFWYDSRSFWFGMNETRIHAEDLWDWRSSGRSADERVPDPALEGWKVLVTYGYASGKFNQLNTDGSIRERKNSFDMATFELGYVRSTGGRVFNMIPYPNYLGFGMSILPEVRTSLYPLSAGWWYIPQSRFWFAGVRLNLGARLEEGHTEDNPDNRLRAQFEASAVVDAGFEIYAPIALYIRAEPLTFVGRGWGSTTQADKSSIESLFNGRGAITLGLRFDLANVF